MSQDVALGNSTSRPAPITRLPAEILSLIFKTYAKSYPEIRDARAGYLCLVSRYWNTIANSTPHLWTEISLIFPFADDHLDVARRRIRTSKRKNLDIFIDFRDPHREWEQSPNDAHVADEPAQSVWVSKILTLLGGTAERWESIEVVSRTWFPLGKIIEGWTFTDLLSVKSISIKLCDSSFGLSDTVFEPQLLPGPVTLFGRAASLPKLRNLSLCAVHVDWNDALGSYQNLRKLELINFPYNIAPSFEEFAEILSFSPRLEYLDVSGFLPKHHLGPTPTGQDPQIPVVYLPALKDFIFGWKDVDSGHKFLQMFQIGSSLENLTLTDTESGIGFWKEGTTGDLTWANDSQKIFEVLYDLGSNAPQDKSDIPPGPFISMRGVKSLEIFSTEVKGHSLIPFVMMLTELESILLEDVEGKVLKDVASVLVGGDDARRALMELKLRWVWEDEIPDFAESVILQLESAGIRVAAEVGECY
jgi:hypothetical protein